MTNNYKQNNQLSVYQNCELKIVNLIRKLPKVFGQTNMRDHIYKTLGTSIITSPLVPPSLEMVKKILKLKHITDE